MALLPPFQITGGARDRKSIDFVAEIIHEVAENPGGRDCRERL